MLTWLWLTMAAAGMLWAVWERRQNSRLQAAARQEQEKLQQNAGKRIQLSEARLNAILSMTADLMTRMDLHGVILAVYIRPGLHSPQRERRVAGKRLDAVCDVMVADRYRQAMEQAILTERPQYFSYETEYGGRTCGWAVWLTVCGDELIAVERDVTEKVTMTRQLSYLTWYDSLTGLFNRSRFEQELRYFGSERHCVVGIVVCDLDGLKLINDTLGHEQGDRQLAAVGDILRRCFRQEGCIARIGGDEFAAIVPEADVEALTAICRKIAQEVEEYNQLLPNARLGLSVGYASRNCPVDLNALFAEAENDMYRQKRLRDPNVREFILGGMLQSVEVRDYFDSGHPQRVEEYAVRLAGVLALSEEQTEELRLLSRYHDIGTVGLDNRLVMNPGQLTADERQAITRHCEIGSRIARSVSGLEPVADLILKHHEQWDGSGYPLGLKNTEIPLQCRILAIADAYEVMTAGRPYRQAMSKAEAMAELRRGAGTQFDPELVELFVNVLESTQP